MVVRQFAATNSSGLVLRWARRREVMETKVIKTTSPHVSPELRQMMTLVANGLSLVAAVRKIRGERQPQLLPVGRPKPTDE